MKKLIFLGIGSALIFTMGGVGPAQADNYPHISSAMGADSTRNIAVQGAGRCAGCHRAHTAKAEMLLKSAQPDLCYSCHKAGAMGSGTDIANGKDANTGEGLRGGGFDFALIGSGIATKTMGPALVPDPITGVMPPSYKQLHSATVPVLAAGQATTSKHQIDGVATGTMWGNGAISASIADTGKANVKLECGSCHDPHGNGNYRILKPVPNDAGTLVQTVITPASTNPTTGVVTPAEMSAPTTGVNIPDAQTKTYTTGDYWLVTDRNVPTVKGGALPAVATTDGYIANASQWCSTCHTRYLAGSNSYKEALTGANGVVDANFTYRHRSNRVDKAGVERPNCIQCHVSHGSNASMSGYAAGVADPGGTTSASSRLLRIDNRGTCVACHNV